MKIYYDKYKILSGYDVYKYITEFFKDNECPLTKYQDELLFRKWGENIGMHGNLSLPFQAYEWKKQKSSKTKFENILYRLSIPLFILFIIIMTLIIRPIKWFINGKWFWDYNSKIENFIKKWAININGEKF